MTWAAGLDPKRTLVTFIRLVPLIVTWVPPSTDPVAGLIAVTVDAPGTVVVVVVVGMAVGAAPGIVVGTMVGGGVSIVVGAGGGQPGGAAMPLPAEMMGFLASAAARIDAVGAAHQLYELLVEHPALAIRVGPIAGWWGPSDHHLGGLCRVLGRLDEAERRMRRSLRTSTLMGSPPWQVRSQPELARLLDRQHELTGRAIGAEAAELRSAAVTAAERLSAPGLLNGE